MPRTAAGETIEITVDLMLAHDGSGAALLEAWENRRAKMYDPRRLLITVDHAFPAPTPEERRIHRGLADFAQRYGCALYNHGEGVLHQVAEEKAALRPGMIIAGADGHVATAGARGALAFSLTPAEFALVLQTGRLKLTVPEVLTIELTGAFRPDVSVRDAALVVMRDLAGVIAGKAAAFTGSLAAAMSLSDRMALCNIIPESGAATAFVVPADEDAGRSHYVIDVGGIEAMLAAPPAPTNIRPVRELRGTPVSVAVAGGCSAGRLSDMEIIANILRVHPVHRDVTFIIAPASRTVANGMDAKGWSSLLRARGALVLPPGCGPCPGKHSGLLAPGDSAVTTTVRNTPGRMGAADADIYLASPYTVAKAAVKGFIG